MTDLQALAVRLGTEGPVKTIPTSRQVRVLFNGVYIVRTVKAVFVWEHPYYPQYYIPASEFGLSQDSDVTINDGETYTSPDGTEVGKQWILKVGNKTLDKTIAFSDNLSGAASALAGLVKIDFSAVDHWFEEDTPIFVHPKDPYKRIDILASSRHLRIRVDGHVVADTHISMHLYETGLPCRYYLPLTAIDPKVLRPSTTRTKCPYKGEAEYYSVEVNGKLHEDIVWFYDRPLLESAKVEGLCCFYNEKVEIELDGKILEKPASPFGQARAGRKPNLS